MRKSQLAESKPLSVDQFVALDDVVAFGALAPVDIVANTIRGTTSKLLFNKVKEGRLCFGDWRGDLCLVKT